MVDPPLRSRVRLALSAEYVRELLDYSPRTGVLKWRRRSLSRFASEKAWKVWNTRYAGKIAGYDAPYRIISIDDANYHGHRLAWIWMKGEDPLNTIDHIDRNPANNKWKNLRQATQGLQIHNGTIRSDSLSKLRGVQRGRRRKGWIARITKDGVKRHLGTFATAEEASEAYKAAARELYD